MSSVLTQRASWGRSRRRRRRNARERMSAHSCRNMYVLEILFDFLSDFPSLAFLSPLDCSCFILPSLPPSLPPSLFVVDVYCCWVLCLHDGQWRRRWWWWRRRRRRRRVIVMWCSLSKPCIFCIIMLMAIHVQSLVYSPFLNVDR